MSAQVYVVTCHDLDCSDPQEVDADRWADIEIFALVG